MTNTRTKQTRNKEKFSQLWLFITFKCKLLKISVDLQTAFAAKTRLAGGQWLEEQLNAINLRMF
jgi:hypothetical protein